MISQFVRRPRQYDMAVVGSMDGLGDGVGETQSETMAKV